MATQPAKPAAPAHAQPEAAKLDPKPDKPAYVDGPPIADQQRASSAEIERKGVARYLEEIDERDEDDKGKQVPGVAPPAKRS